MIIDRIRPHDGSNEYCPQCEEQIDRCRCECVNEKDETEPLQERNLAVDQTESLTDWIDHVWKPLNEDQFTEQNRFWEEETSSVSEVLDYIREQADTQD